MRISPLIFYVFPLEKLQRGFLEGLEVVFEEVSVNLSDEFLARFLSRCLTRVLTGGEIYSVQVYWARKAKRKLKKNLKSSDRHRPIIFAGF